MPHTPTKIPFHSKSRRLLLAVFTTLFLVAVSFGGTFAYFNHLNQGVFKEFEVFTRSANINADISRELIGLELKIREMISTVLSSPEKLPRIRNELLKDFADLKEDVSDQSQPGNQTIDTALDNYKTALDALMQGYTAMNNSLISLRAFYEKYSGRLGQLEETVGKLIVEVALSGQDSTGLQQNYLLIPLCVEEFVNGHMLVRSSVTDSNPAHLGVANAEGNEAGSRPTTFSHLDIMEKTLSTMTSAQDPIGSEAQKMLKEIQPYREQIRELHRILLFMGDDSKNFIVARNSILKSMKDIDDQTAQGLVSIRTLISKHNYQEYIVSFVISGTMLLVSVLGFLVAWKMSHQLEATAKRTVLANQQLQQEIHERQKIEEVLRQSRDELELRVNERTAEITEVNLQLQTEIVERLDTAKVLADERERLLVTLRSIGDGVICTDTIGNVTLINKIAEELTGWSMAEAAGKQLTEIFHIINEQTGKLCGNPVEKVLLSGQIVGLANHTALVARDGSRRSIADSGAPIRDHESKIVGVVLVFRDVTEQVRMEAELLKVRKLESVGVLAGGIAHDFNNILAAILGNINMAVLDTSINSETRHLLAEAERASIRAKGLTQQLLTFAKGGEPVKETALLQDIVGDSAEFVLRGGKVSCQYHFAKDLRPVEIDKDQISQVVQNIVLNARQAMPDGGTIAIRGENVMPEDPAFHAANKGDDIKLVISDTGVGIPATVIDKIFDPYFSTKQDGSGLGLAICYSIINKHHGRLSVQSQPGRGTDFTIYLPASEKTMTNAPPSQEEHRTSSPAKILVMDDEVMVRSVAKAMLTKLGHEVVLAENGEMALKFYQEALDLNKLFDLVIMDLTIPGGMGGKDAVQEILKVNPDAKVIVSSGYSNDPIMANCRDYGFCAAIEKPFQLQELSTVINQLLEL